MRRTGLVLVALMALVAAPVWATPKTAKPSAPMPVAQVKITKPDADKRKAKGFAKALPAEPAVNCVQFVKQNSDFQITGDGWRWWDNAAGRYARSKLPEVGSVLVFKKAKRMVHGHVALVSTVVDKRTILVDHANWAPRGGGKGKVERGVRVEDISKKNDWSEVRVWYRPINDLGSPYPTAGFVHPKATKQPLPSETRMAAAAAAAESPDLFDGVDEIEGVSQVQVAGTSVPLQKAGTQPVAQTVLPAKFPDFDDGATSIRP